MKSSQSSSTAELMALSRAIETRKPSQEQICCDPLAEQFLSYKYKLLLLNRPFRNAVEKIIEARFIGHHYYVIARTRYIDDFLQEQLNSDIKQLVILGAGYDSRAYRFADRLRNIKVFEVDHPATSKAKKNKIRNLLGTTPSNLIYVRVDFNVEKLSDKLKRNGFKEKQKTLFLWEGVTPYVSKEGINDVLQFIATRSGQGSIVIFDYIIQTVIDGTNSQPGAKKDFEKMKKSNEPLVSGIAEGKISSFLSKRGFSNIVDAGSQELQTLYFSNGTQNRMIKPWWRIAHATVA